MQRVNWFEVISLPIAIAAMVAAWINPWLRWIIRAAGHDPFSPVPSALTMVAVILIGAFVTRVALSRRLRHTRGVVLGAGFAAIVIVAWFTYGARFPLDYLRALIDWQNSISPEVIVLMATALLWWRGILIGRTRVLIDESFDRSFFNGIIAFGFLLFLNNFSQYVPAADMLAAVLTFFAMALSVLTLVSIERTRLRQLEPTGSWLKLNRHWLATIAAVVSAILLGALGITGVASPDTLQRWLVAARPLLDSLGDVLRSIIVALASILFWLVSPLFPILEFLLRLILNGLMGALSILHQLGVQIDQLRLQQDFDNFLNSQTFASISRGVAVVIVLIVFAVLAVYALRRWGVLPKKNLDETRESIASRQLVLNQLKNWLARWRRRPPAAAPLPYLPLTGDDPRVIVRRLYQTLLAWAAAQGQSREPRQTPAMYADVLTTLSPQSPAAIGTLTEVYVRARYANEPLTPDDARLAAASLDTLQAADVIQSSSTGR